MMFEGTPFSILLSYDAFCLQNWVTWGVGFGLFGDFTHLRGFVTFAFKLVRGDLRLQEA